MLGQVNSVYFSLGPVIQDRIC